MDDPARYPNVTFGIPARKTEEVDSLGCCWVFQNTRLVFLLPIFFFSVKPTGLLVRYWSTEMNLLPDFTLNHFTVPVT